MVAITVIELALKKWLGFGHKARVAFSPRAALPPVVTRSQACVILRSFVGKL